MTLLWVDGFSQPMALLTPGLAVKAELSPRVSRVKVTSSGGGFEVRGWATPSSIPIYMRQPRPLRGVVEPYPTTPVFYRGFDGTDVALGYPLRDGVVPDVLDVSAPCSQLTLERPSGQPASWDRTRSAATLATDVWALPLSAERGGRVALELSMAQGGYAGELFEIVEKRGPDTKIRWVRPRETLVGWVPTALLAMAEDEPEPIEPMEAEPAEDRFWPGTHPDDSESRRCPHDVPLYLAPSDEGEAGAPPIEVGRIEAGTYFRAPEELDPSTTKQPLLYLDDDALEALTGTGHAFVVAVADLKGCTAPRRP